MPVNPLLAGLAAGFQAFGTRKLEEASAARKADEMAQLKQYEEAAARNKAIFEAALRGSKNDTFKTTGDDGKVYEVTQSSRVDPATGQIVTEEIGRAPLLSEPKAPQTRTYNRGGTSVTEQFDAATGQWTELATAPRWQPERAGGGGGGGSGADISFADYQAMTPEERRAYDKYKGRAERTDEDKRDRRLANVAIKQEMAAFDKLYPSQQAKMLVDAGIDPKASGAREQYRKAVRARTMLDYGIVDDEPEAPQIEVQEGSRDNMPPGRPGSSQSNPVDAASLSSEPPKGTWIKLPNGRVTQVR